MGDEVQQGEGNVLDMSGTTIARGEASGDGDDGNDKDLNKKKESIPKDKTLEKKKPSEEEEG